jgi:hypothetical protein
LQDRLKEVPDIPISAISLDLSHTSTVADIASSTSEKDRSKMVYHETTACLRRAPLKYAQCYQGLPVFVSSGFDLALYDCCMKSISPDFHDYGQWGRLEETVNSEWWSFAARQKSAYEKGGLGWSYSTWKVF